MSSSGLSLGLVVASSGGVTYEAGGAHTVVDQFLEAYALMVETYPLLEGVRLSVVAPELASSSLDRRDDLTEIARRACEQSGGRVELVRFKGRPFDGYTDVYGDARDVVRREEIAGEFARAVGELAAEHSRTVVLAHGDLMSWLSTCLAGRHERSSTAVFWFAHVLSKMYDPVYESRLRGERRALAAFSVQDRVVAVGETVARILQDEYGVMPGRLLRCYNEVFPAAARYVSLRGTHENVLDRPFVLFCGRGVPEKRAHLVLEMYLDDLNETLPDLVLICPDEGGSPYNDELAGKVDELNTRRRDRVQYLPRYQTDLLHAAVQSPHLRAVIMPSAMELRTILGLEYVALTPAGIPIVYNDLPTMREVFYGRDGTYPAAIETSDDLRQALDKALETTITTDPSKTYALHRYTGTFAQVMEATSDWLHVTQPDHGSADVG